MGENTLIAPGEVTKVTNKPLTRPEVGYWFGVILFLVICGAIGIFLQNSMHSRESWIPAAGIGIFAPIYIATQALERLLEPLSHFYGMTPEPKAGFGRPAPDQAATQARKEVLGKRALPQSPEARRAWVTKSRATRLRDAARERNDTDEAARWQEALIQIRRNAATLWAVASGLGMVLAGWIGFLLLHAIGVFQAGDYGWFDVIITGLVIGGGTKPLHDLIGNLQGSSEAKRDQPASSA